MRHKLKEIPPEGLSCAETLPDALLDEAFADTDVMSGEGVVRGAALHVQLFKNGSDVVANGKLSAQLTMPCSRCLGPAAVVLDLPVQALFVPEGDGRDQHDNDDKDVDPDEPDRLTHDRIAVDLAPLARELLIVNLPMTVLCKEGCLGLCGQCGQDRNVTDCGHSQAAVELPTTQRLPLGDLAKHS